MRFTGILEATLAITAITAISAVFAAHAKELTYREKLDRVAPSTAEAVRRVEFQRGAPVADAELLSLLQSTSFQRVKATVLTEFCDQEHNKTVLACIYPYRAAPTGSGPQ